MNTQHDSPTPSIRIIVTSSGVTRVQLCADSWPDEASIRLLYDSIRPFIQDLDRFLTSKGPAFQNSTVL